MKETQIKWFHLFHMSLILIQHGGIDNFSKGYLPRYISIWGKILGSSLKFGTNIFNVCKEDDSYANVLKREARIDGNSFGTKVQV